MSACSRAWVRVLSGLYYRQEDLSQLQAKEAQLRQAQKLRVMGQLTTEFAGEINKHLEVIIGEASLLREGDLAPAVGDGVQAVYEAGLQARSTSERLLACARQQKTRKEWVNLTHIVQETALLMRRTLLKDQIEIAEDLAPNLPYIKAHAGQLQQVVLNLIQNSRDAIKQARGAGRIVLRVSIRQGWIVLEIEDNGPGIPAEIRDDIFAPFFHDQGVESKQWIGVECMCWHCPRPSRPPTRRRLCSRGLCGLGTAHQSARRVSEQLNLVATYALLLCSGPQRTTREIKRMVIVLMGVTGSGKTTVGEQLAQQLGWAYYDADDFHPEANVHKMASGTPLTDEDRWPWLETLSAAIDHWLRTEQGAILGCSALKQSYRDILVSGRPGVQIVHLKGPKATHRPAAQRAAAPLHASQPTRQPVCDPRRTARRTERGHRPFARSHCHGHRTALQL